MLQLHTFGALDLRRDGLELRSVLSQPKRAGLFVYLVLGSPSGFVSRDTLLASFWPESDDERARNALRQALHYLRRSLGDRTIVSRGDRELGVESTEVWCDALAFRAALREGRPEAALDLYRGEFLPGFYIDEAPSVERMIEQLRSDFRREALGAANGLIERDERLGELRAAALWARRATAIAPYDEAAVRRLMTLLEQNGEVAAAAEAYREFETRLKADLDLTPAEETTRQAEAIRARSAAGSRLTSRDSVAEQRAPTPARSEVNAVTTRSIGAMQPPTYAEIFPATDPTDTQQSAKTDLSANPDAARQRKMQPSLNRHRRAMWWLTTAATSIALLIGLQFWRGDRNVSTKASEARAIAVLPFTNMTGDPANEFFADGISEELLNVLTRVPELKVAARTSSFAFKGTAANVDSVAKVLGVTHVLEGSVRGEGSRVRITAQLIEARTGFHLWSETYDRQLNDVLNVQDEISRAIAKALEFELRGPISGAARSETSDPEAYRLLVRALQVFRTPGRENYAESAALLEEAIRRDPEYARAYGALATVRVWQANFQYLPSDSALAEARRLAEKSLALREVPEAHMALGRLAELLQWDQAVADQHLRRALELNPGDARAIQMRGMLLVRMGQVDQGLAMLRRATELDPLHPGAFSNLGAMLARTDRMQEAIIAFNRALELSPDDPIVLQNLANVHAELRNHDLALNALNRALARTPDDMNLKGLRAYVQVRAGQREAATRSLVELERIPDFSRYRLATLYAHLDSGNTSAASVNRIITFLEQAAERREPDIAGFQNSNDFITLRTHPRMVRLLEQMKSAAQ